METSLCTCGHPAHIFACWGDNGECACREHAPVQKVDETKSKYVVAFDAHDGFWWAIGAGKALPGMNPVEALQALLLAITGEALLRG